MKTYIAKTGRGALIGLRFFITLLALYWLRACMGR